MEEKEIRERLEKDYLHCRIILEVLGKPKGYVEESLKTYLEKIKKESQENFLKAEVIEAEKTKEEVQKGEEYYATFAEMELLFKDILELSSFCFNYMPSSIEIIKPDSLVLRNVDLNNIFNDLQAKSHQVDSIAKALRSENEFLRRNMKNLLKNVVLITLNVGDRDLMALSRITGVKEKELQKFLEEMIKENAIKKEGETYMLV